MADDLFPDKPNFEDIQDMKPSKENMLKNSKEIIKNPESWYNLAPYAAARIIIQAAQNSDEFKNYLLENSDDIGVAHGMEEFDKERHVKINSMGLSAFQGRSAENMAINYIKNQDE